MHKLSELMSGKGFFQRYITGAIALNLDCFIGAVSLI
jgi:hypothetical protein